MILVTGGYGFLGSEVCKRLDQVSLEYYRFRSSEYDLRDPDQVNRLFQIIKPTSVIHIGARLGGIKDNVENPFNYFSDNLKMGINVVDNCIMYNLDHFIGINTACSYPLNAKQPFTENDINDGLPAEANLYYGLSKRTILNYSEIASKTYKFKASNLILTNMFGIDDDFNEQTSHVIPALIKKIDIAKENNTKLEVWGNPSVSRDFMTSEYASKIITETLIRDIGIGRVNVASGKSVTIGQIVSFLCDYFEFYGAIEWQEDKPTGQPLRSMDVKTLHELFSVKANPFFEDLKTLCDHFVNNKKEILAKSEIKKFK